MPSAQSPETIPTAFLVVLVDKCRRSLETKAFAKTEKVGDKEQCTAAVGAAEMPSLNPSIPCRAKPRRTKRAWGRNLLETRHQKENKSRREIPQQVIDELAKVSVILLNSVLATS